MTDEIGMGMRFVRSWIGGPMAGAIWMVRPHIATITITNGSDTIGRYVRCNLGWTWHEAQS